MYAQLFGAYLLEKKAITSDQLTEALSSLNDAHIKLGTLAIHQGLMTASEVDEVCLMQTREDKRFGEIAVSRGYLTDEQVSMLLKSQNPDYLLLGQTLVDKGYLTNSDFETLLIDYQSDTEIYDMTYDNSEKTELLIKRFFQVAEHPVSEHAVMYLNLLFNNLIRFIGGDFTPTTPLYVEEYPVSLSISQKIHGDKDFTTRIDMDEDVAIHFASRYAKMDFNEFDEYVQASLEDFLNLHNGLFTVNISNDYSIDLLLAPPEKDNCPIIDFDTTTYVFPIIYPFGNIHFILTL